MKQKSQSMSDHSSDTVSAWSPTVIIVQTPTEPPLIPSIMSFHSSMPTLISEMISNLPNELIFNSDTFSKDTEMDFTNFSPFQVHHYSSQIVLPFISLSGKNPRSEFTNLFVY